MFTGIIEAVGKIDSIKRNQAGARLTIAVGQLDMSDVKLGDSIATNGVCLTVVAFDKQRFSADLSNETLAKSQFAHSKIGDSVNLEKAMLANARFGGHIVAGHVDGAGEIKEFVNNGNSVEYWIEVAPELSRYLVAKGSVTVDGVSLTVNAVKDQQFKLTIVPHTSAQTIMPSYRVGQRVNIEVDLIARYLEKLLQPHHADSERQSVSVDLLTRTGFIK